MPPRKHRRGQVTVFESIVNNLRTSLNRTYDLLQALSWFVKSDSRCQINECTGREQTGDSIDNLRKPSQISSASAANTELADLHGVSFRPDRTLCH